MESELIQFSIDEDGATTTFLVTQSQYDAMVVERTAMRTARHAKGHYTMHEAAEVLAAANSIGSAARFVSERMQPAVESGSLVLLDPIDAGPVKGRRYRLTDWVTPANANKWLEKDGFSYRWPVTATESKAAPAVTPERAPMGDVNELTGLPFCEALQQPEYQKTPEYQAEYAKAWQSLDAKDEIEKSIKESEAIPALDWGQQERKKQEIAALKAKRDALMASVFPIEPQQPAPAQNTTTPAPVVTGQARSDAPAPPNKIVHSTKTRRDSLTPVIEQAQRQCSDPQDTAAVWAALLVLAEMKTAPLIGATEDGLQYLKNGTAASFNRDALRKRLGR